MNDRKELSPVNVEFFGFMDEVMPKLDKSDEDKILGFALGLAAKNVYSQEKEKTPA